MYNHQQEIDASAYQRGLRDAQVSAYLNRYEQQKLSHDTNYIDKDFVDNPDLMHTQDYVEAAYNPQVQVVASGPPTVIGQTFLWILVVGFGILVLFGLVLAGYFLLTRIRVGD